VKMQIAQGFVDEEFSANSLRLCDKYGIKYGITIDRTTGFNASLTNWKGIYILAFEGTAMTSGKDWWANIWQGVGGRPEQYNQALALAKAVQASVGNRLIVIRVRLRRNTFLLNGLCEKISPIFRKIIDMSYRRSKSTCSKAHVFLTPRPPILLT